MNEKAQVPIRKFAYEVTRADALAFTMLRHELSWWDKLRLLVLIGVAGLLAGLVPHEIGPVWWWTSVAAILGVAGIAAIAWTNLDVRRKAASLPVPAGRVTLQQWDDHISEHHAAGVRKVDYDRISHAVLTQGHVFIRAEAVPIIVPRRAFETMEDMQAFAADIDKRSRRSAS